MGSWLFMEREFRKFDLEPKAVTREEGASPATGSTLHQQEQEAKPISCDRETTHT
jgi:hypothetical protein